MLNLNIDSFLSKIGIKINYTDTVIDFLDRENKQIGNILFLNDNDVCYVIWISVDAEHQTRGFGTLLLYSVIQQASKLNISTAKLSAVGTANNFYLKNGFVAEGKNSLTQMSLDLCDPQMIDVIEHRVESIISNNTYGSKKRKRQQEDNEETKKLSSSNEINVFDHWKHKDFEVGIDKSYEDLGDASIVFDFIDELEEKSPIANTGDSVANENIQIVKEKTVSLASSPCSIFGNSVTTAKLQINMKDNAETNKHKSDVSLY